MSPQHWRTPRHDRPMTLADIWIAGAATVGAATAVVTALVVLVVSL